VQQPLFPSDEITREFLKQEEEDQWINLEADSGATYDKEIEIDLSAVETLIALPGSPGDVVTVREVRAYRKQVVIGSSANPGLRDFGSFLRL
jgi:aconitate hydratase